MDEDRKRWTDLQVQTRSEENGLLYHKTFKGALKHADEDPSVWKISFSLSNGERVRLVKTATGWLYSSLPD